MKRFEAEYRDAVEERVAQKPHDKGKGDKNAGAGGEAKGPKLGGSRSARAAMAAREKAGGNAGGGVRQR